MVVDDFDVVRIGVFPSEADASLIVDTDTVLARAIPFQLLKAVPRRHPRVVERLGGIHGDQFPQHHPAEFRRVSSHRLAAEQARRITIAKTLDHGKNIPGALVTSSVTMGGELTPRAKLQRPHHKCERSELLMKGLCQLQRSLGISLARGLLRKGGEPSTRGPARRTDVHGARVPA